MKNSSAFRLLSLFCVFIFSLAVLANQHDFQKNFNIAKQHLSKREIIKALPYLQYLRNHYPENSNLKYLVGVCYVEAEIINQESVHLLSEATTQASLEYDPNSLSETRVPIYVYYYLSIAHSQNGECEKAKEVRSQFLEVYPYEDEYYISESKLWLNKCQKQKDQKKVDIPRFPDFKPYESSPIVQKQKKINDAGFTEKKEVKPKKEIKTKKIEYTTNYPLYGVQLGAYKEVVPVGRFKELKNVDAFMDKEGWIRYVIGHFSIPSQAESLLKLVQGKGYPDAFVVNVNNEKKFSDEVVSINNVNIKAKLSGDINYKIQIGAFKEKIPLEMAERYFQIDGIEEFVDNDFTCLFVGDYKTYEEAKAYLQGINDMKMTDAFVVAINNGKKISLQSAKDYYAN